MTPTGSRDLRPVRRTLADPDPPATPAEYRAARLVARSTARALVAGGARAVVWGGSWVRGDAHRASDVDLWVFGGRRGPAVLWRAPFLVCLSRTTEALERRRLRRPPRLGGSVPGWRVAVPLYDPDGIAARLQAAAASFTWASVARRCDRWVAESTVAWAEEAIKLVRAVSEGNLPTACVQRNLLVDALGFVLAIDRRTFWDSENEFWERIGAEVGGRWAVAQRRALGIGTRSPMDSCRAALDLYAETVDAVRARLSPEERSIAGFAVRTAAPVRRAAGPGRLRG